MKTLILLKCAQICFIGPDKWVCPYELKTTCDKDEVVCVDDDQKVCKPKIVTLGTLEY